MKRRYSAVIALAMAASMLWVGERPAHAGQCSGLAKLGVSWMQRSGLAKASLSVTHCAAVAACEGVISTGATVLTASPIVLTITDALGQTFTTSVETKGPACASICTESKKASCPGGSETFYGLDGRRLRYTFGHAGQVNVLASKLPIPSINAPNLTPPILMNLTDANGYSLDMRATICLTKQKLGSYSVRCY